MTATLKKFGREIGPNLITAARHARAAAWRFKRSPEQRDRAAAFATFAFIGLFAVGSVDAIITGGADFGPSSAYATEYTPAHSSPLVQTALIVEPVEAPPAPEKALIEEIDYSHTNEELLGGPELVLEAMELTPEVSDMAADTLKTIL